MTHVILLDNRFDFDKETGDRLGEDQWKWLENAFAWNRDRGDVHVTVIGAGI